MGQNQEEQDVKEGMEPDFKGRGEAERGEAERGVLSQEKKLTEKNTADGQLFLKKPRRNCGFVRGGY